MPLSFFTIGHSNRSAEVFAGLLREADIALVADIRRLPGSRTQPQFNADPLRDALAQFRIAYEHIGALGGRRGRSRGVPADVNGLWTNRSFHNYADYALTEPFQAGLQHLIEEGRRRRCAMMCAEAVWWRCHRRIVADYLLTRGETVIHIIGEGRFEPARVTAGAIPQPDGTVVYAAPQPVDRPRPDIPA